MPFILDIYKKLIAIAIYNAFANSNASVRVIFFDWGSQILEIVSLTYIFRFLKISFNF